MTEPVVYIAASTVICTGLLLMIFSSIRLDFTYHNSNLVLSVILALLSGVTLVLLPALALLSLGTAPWSMDSLLFFSIRGFGLATLFFIIFLFLTFVEADPLKAKPMQTRMARTHLVLSAVISLMILTFTYSLTSFHSSLITITKENASISFLILSATIYSTARIFERLHIDQLVVKKHVPFYQTAGLFALISVSLSSTLYTFIQGLFLQSNFLIQSIERIGVLLLLFTTIAYIERQFHEQQKQLHQKHKELLIQEQHYRSLFANNPEAVFTLDFKGRFQACNQSAILLTGYTKEELLSLTLYDLVLPEDHVRFIRAYHSVLSGVPEEFEVTIRNKFRQSIHVKVTCFMVKVDALITGVYAIVEDITSEKQTKQRIEYLAYHDELTGLLNRRGIKRYYENFMVSQSHEMALILFDIDLFKQINDHMGHSNGDDLLKQVGERLNHAIQMESYCARIGGDEFLICLPNYQMKCNVHEEIKALQQEMAKWFYLDNHRRQITLSIGVSYFPEDGMDFSTLIKHADMAMYEVKRNGRNNYLEFSGDTEPTHYTYK